MGKAKGTQRKKNKQIFENIKMSNAKGKETKQKKG